MIENQINTTNLMGYLKSNCVKTTQNWKKNGRNVHFETELSLSVLYWFNKDTHCPV